jgi:PAS domain S-box-containing protein
LNINTKIIAVFLAVGLIPLIFTGYVSFETAKNTLSTQITDDLKALSGAKADQIITYLESLEARTIDFSSDGFIRDYAEKIQAGENGNTTNALNQHLLLNKKPLDQSIVGVFIIGNNGTVLAATDPAEAGRDEREDEYFIKGKLGAHTAVTSEEHRHFGLNESIVVSAPLTSRLGGKPLGAIVNVFNVTKINGLIAGRGAIETGALPKETEIFVVDKNREMIFHSAPYAGQNRHYLFMAVDTVPVRKCLVENRSFTGVYENDDGNRVFGSAACIPDKGWTLVIESEAETAFAPINALSAILLSLIAATALLIIFASWILARTIATPIESLTRAINDISTGNLDAEINPEIKRSDDEIGDLANAFDRTIASLKLAMMQTAPEMKKHADELKKTLAEKNASEKQLAEEKQIVEKYFALASTMLVVLDAEGRVVRVNQKTCDVLGRAPGEMLGKPWIDTAVSEKNRKACRGEFEKLKSKGQTATCRCELVAKNGKVEPAEWHNVPLTDDAGKFIGALYCGHERGEDVEKFRRIFNLSPEVIVLLDPQGTITDANPRVTDWIGYLPEELVGKRLSELPFLPLRSKAKAIANYAKRVAGLPIAPYDLEFTSKEGKLVVGRMSGSTIKDREGKITGSIIMINRMDGENAAEGKAPGKARKANKGKTG